VSATGRTDGLGAATGDPGQVEDELWLFLAMIGGGDRDGFFEVRWPRSAGSWGQLFHPVTRPRSLVETILNLGRNTDAYVGAAPRTHRHGGTEAIGAVYSLWADCDGPDAVAGLDAFTPAPSVVILSGSGDNRHAYWQLDRPLTPSDAKRGNRRLAHHLGADMRATDAARILRPPGTLNHKHAPPAPVVCERLEAESHNPLDVVGSLPDPEPPISDRPAPAVARPATRSGRGDPLREIPAEVYVPALTGRPIGRDGKVRCPSHAGGEERTPSLHAYRDDGGWFCFGCDQGGGIVELAGLLYGIDTRALSKACKDADPARAAEAGRAFVDLRRRIAGELLEQAA